MYKLFFLPPVIINHTMSHIIIRSPDSGNARSFSVTIKPPASIAGKKCNVRLLTGFISDMYSISDSLYTMQDTSIAIELSGLIFTLNNTAVNTDFTSVVIGVFQKGMWSSTPNIEAYIPHGPFLLTVSVSNLELSWPRSRVTLPTGLSKTHGFSSLAHLYRFESTSSGACFNDVTKAYDSSFTGSTTTSSTTSAVGSSCLDLKGDGYFRFPSYQSSTGALSFAFWYRMASKPSTWVVFLHSTSNPASNYTHLIWISVESTGKLSIRVRGDSGDTMNVQSVYQLLYNGTWNHLVVTFSTSNVCTVYHNGTSVYSNTNCPYPPSVSRTFNVLGAQGSLASFYNGKIDDFRLYTKVLSQSEISQLYAKDASPQSCTLALELKPK